LEDPRLNQKYCGRRNERLALAGVIAGLVLIASPRPVLASNFFLCTAQEVAVFPGSRIHVLCNPGDGQITFFALSVANPDVSRVLSLAETAVAARRTLRIMYDPNDLSGAAIGCANTNCRLIQGIYLLRQ
jgi:hypothetical protein